MPGPEKALPQRAHHKSLGFSDRWITIPLFLGALFLGFVRFADLQKRFHNIDWFTIRPWKENAAWIVGLLVLIGMGLAVPQLRSRRRESNRGSD